MANQRYYQPGFVDRMELVNGPDLTFGGVPVQFQVPHRYQDTGGPFQVSPDALDRPEGPQVPSAELNGQWNFRREAPKARTPIPGPNDRLEEPLAKLDIADGERGVPTNWSEPTGLGSPDNWFPPTEWSDPTAVDQGQIPAQDGSLDDESFPEAMDLSEENMERWFASISAAENIEQAANASLEEPPAQSGHMAAWRVPDLPDDEFVVVAAIEALGEPQAQPGIAEGAQYQPADEVVPAAVDLWDEPQAQPGIAEGAQYQPADEVVPAAVDLWDEPQAQPGIAEGAQYQPADEVVPAAVDLWDEPQAQPGIAEGAQYQPAAEVVPAAVDPWDEPQAQPGIAEGTQYQPAAEIVPAAVDLWIEPQILPGIAEGAQYQPAAEVVPAAVGLLEERQAQPGLVDMAWWSDLPDEQSVNNLGAVVAYHIDSDYHAKAMFVLENPEAKLTEDHLPEGKGQPPAFKFATNRDYKLGNGPDGSKVIYRKDGEEPTTQIVPQRDQIWAILCQAHKDATTGRHCGRDKTKENVERNYYGVTKKIIDNFLDACPVCNTKRTERRAQLKARQLAKQQGESPTRKRKRTV